jgi:hypothetical protein
MGFTKYSTMPTETDIKRSFSSLYPEQATIDVFNP